MNATGSGHNANETMKNISEINQFRQNEIFFRQGRKLVVNSDDMTTDQKH